MVAIGSVPLRYDKEKRLFTPIFLSENDDEIIKKAIMIFQNQEGKIRSDYVNEDFLDHFSDFRMASILHEVLISQFFGFTPLSVGFSPNKRIRLWKILAEKMPQGYASSAESRQKHLKELAQEISINSAEILEQQLFFDHRDLQQLVQITRPTAKAVINAYNKLILTTLLNSANWVRFKIDPKASLEGSAFKQLLFLAKRYGVYLEVFTEKNRRVIEILGPKKLVLRGTRYSSSLGRILKIATGFAFGGDHGFDPVIELGLRRGKGIQIVQLPFEVLAWFQEERKEGNAFDSEVERKLYYQLSGGPWKVSREPFLHFEKESIFFLPDFCLSLHDSSVMVYIEIVGFWTNEYLEKKVEKLNRLPSDFKNLLLVVDSALAFPQTRFQTFYYESMKNLPIGEILGFLDREYVQSHSQARQKELLDNRVFLAKEINKTLNEMKFIRMEEIFEILKCRDLNASSQVIKEMTAKGELKHCEFISGHGIVHNELIKSVKEIMDPLFMNTRQIKEWHSVEEALSHAGIPLDAMEPIIKLAGFQIFWKGLTQRFVKFNTKSD
ncbi:MAG: DUF790 family protein [Candidatus Hodarchaeota archaeon]